MEFNLAFVVICWFSFLKPANSYSQQPRWSIVVERGVVLKFLLVETLDSKTANLGDDVPLQLERPLQVTIS